MILVTGATGFIGSAVLAELDSRGLNVRGITRDLNQGSYMSIGNIGPDTDWGSVLSGVDIVIHIAARVHVMDDVVEDPLAEYRKVNLEGTLNLARQAAFGGVKRFIFISSIKVNGESTRPGEYFTADDEACPADPYAISKWEAEVGLNKLAIETGMEVTIIRPPLVYGPGAGGNFRSLIRWVNNGIPLPFGAIRNKRSLVALDNLVSLIITCMNHVAAANQIFLVSDGEDLSTRDLVKRIAEALAKPARIIPIPVWLLNLAGLLLGRRSMVQRLRGSLQVDLSKERKLLGWEPPISVTEAMREVARDFRQ